MVRRSGDRLGPPPSQPERPRAPSPSAPGAFPLPGLDPAPRLHFERYYGARGTGRETLVALLAALERVSPAKQKAVEHGAFVLSPEAWVEPSTAVALVEALASRPLSDLHLGLAQDVRDLLPDSIDRSNLFADLRTRIIAALVRLSPAEREEFRSQLRDLGIEHSWTPCELDIRAALLRLDTPTRRALLDGPIQEFSQYTRRALVEWLTRELPSARWSGLLEEFGRWRRTLPMAREMFFESERWFAAAARLSPRQLERARGAARDLVAGSETHLSALARLLECSQRLGIQGLERLLEDTNHFSRGAAPASRLDLALSMAGDAPRVRAARMVMLAPILEGCEDVADHRSAYDALRSPMSAAQEAAFSETAQVLRTQFGEGWTELSSAVRLGLVNGLSRLPPETRGAVMPDLLRFLAALDGSPRLWLLSDAIQQAATNPTFPQFVGMLENARAVFHEPGMVQDLAEETLHAARGRPQNLPRLFEIVAEFGLAAALEATGSAPAPAPDPENVMDRRRISRTGQAIIALQRIFPPTARPEVRGTLEAIEQHVEGLRVGLEPGEGLGRVRGGAREVDNALRTLRGARGPRDFSDALFEDPPYNAAPNHTVGLGELCALVWHAIDRYPEHAPPATSAADAARDQANMRHSLVMALAQSIEDDGHRVCGVGLSQRLMTVLQGYYPAVQLELATPAQLLTQHAQAFAEQLGSRATPTSSAIRAYALGARANADAMFGQDGEDRSMFSRMLRTHLEFDYPLP